MTCCYAVPQLGFGLERDVDGHDVTDTAAHPSEAVQSGI